MLWASYQIRKIGGAHAPEMPGTFSPPPRVSNPDMHHGTCVTHVPWCMPESLTSDFLWNRRRGKTFPAFPAHAQPAILRIWQEAHDAIVNNYSPVSPRYESGPCFCREVTSRRHCQRASILSHKICLTGWHGTPSLEWSSHNRTSNPETRSSSHRLACWVLVSAGPHENKRNL